VKDKHIYSNANQSEGFNFYVSDRIKIPASAPMGEGFRYKWEEHVDKLDELKRMHHQDLLSLNEIVRLTGIDVWVIEDLFNEFNIEIMGIKKRAKLKRERDFDLIYKLHKIKEMSLNEIYREYGFSPLYSKTVLKDKGINHNGFVNQLKNNKRKGKLK